MNIIASTSSTLTWQRTPSGRPDPPVIRGERPDSTHRHAGTKPPTNINAAVPDGATSRRLIIAG